MTLIRERFYDPHFNRRPSSIAPAFGCGVCGAWTVATADGAVIYPAGERGTADELCTGCRDAAPDELRRRMRDRAGYCRSVADWLEESAAGEIITDPALYVIGPDELAC